ncbi:hypothetical protein Meth11DRAFT_2126 [Methylophilaceae bacterium 11]|nr:hypothetical protein Meth11DRAFT_2126 [Methylophilaceae bacterium 11]
MGNDTSYSSYKLIHSIVFFTCLLIGFSISASAESKLNAVPSKKYFEEYLLMQELQKNMVFDGIVESVDPRLQIEAKECGQANAFYSRSQTKIILCYEYMKQSDAVIDYLYPYPRETIQNRSLLKTGVFMGVLMHELGHAIVHLKDVPVLGNQEDAADSIATIIMLELAKKSPQQGKTMIVGSLAHDWGTRQNGVAKMILSKDLYADEHPLNEQRVFNRICLAYGSNPALFVDTAKQLKLPESRAKRCAGEYQSTKKAVDLLIGSQIQ